MTSNTLEATGMNNDHDDLFAPILPCREVLDHTLSLFHPDGKRLTVEAVENVARTLASMIISSDNNEDINRDQQVKQEAANQDVSIGNDVRETFEIMEMISEEAVCPFSMKEQYECLLVKIKCFLL